MAVAATRDEDRLAREFDSAVGREIEFDVGPAAEPGTGGGENVRGIAEGNRPPVPATTLRPPDVKQRRQQDIDLERSRPVGVQPPRHRSFGPGRHARQSEGNRCEDRNDQCDT